jgi:periplasmic protein TonB
MTAAIQHPAPHDADPSTPPNRLGIALSVAALLHLALILGLGFSEEDRPKPANRALDIALTITKSEEKPKEADFIAQENQQGSGSQPNKSPPKTTESTPVQKQDVQQVATASPPPEVQRPQTPKAVVTTKAPKPEKAPAQAQPEKVTPPQPKTPPAPVFDNATLSSEIANLEAELAQDIERYAKRPRVHRLNGVSSMRDISAWYRDEWRKKVEKVGNLNYPEEAKRQKIHGSLRVLVTINRDGTVAELQVLESSGFPILDNAALRIVRLSAPFAPFNGELAQTYDQIEIIRTWRFDRGDKFSNQL